MSADSPRHTSRGSVAPATVLPQVVNDRSILDSALGFFNEVTLAHQTHTDPKDTITWARFESAADISDPRFGEDWELEGNVAPPLLLILGYGLGVQVWAIPANGEAKEVLSWRHGVVSALRVLPTPSYSGPIEDNGRADEPIDAFAEKRPLIAMVDSSTSSGGPPQFSAVNFISLKTGLHVKTIKFKNAVVDVLANRTSIVITFNERIVVFDARTLEDRLSVTTCYPSPGINPNPVALGPRWLAYAEHRLIPSKRSGGGCDGDGVASYTATVLNAAKSFGKGLRELGEQVAAGLTGTTAGGSISKNSSFDSSGSGDAKQPGIVTIMDIKYPISSTSPTSSTPTGHVGSDPIVAHFIAHSEALVAMEFDNSGMLLLTADRRGHDFHVFRVQAHPVGGSLAAVHHLYVLHRGDTSAKVQNLAFSLDSRWVAVSTLRGTTHVFPITPYGGPIGARTHTSLHVVNKLSRFHRSAGLSADGRSSSPISHSESTTFVQSLLPYHNPTLPPYPRPTVVLPLSQLRQPSVLGSPPASAALGMGAKVVSGVGGSGQRQRLSSLSDDNGKPLSVCAIFAKSRSMLLDPPNATHEAPYRMQRKAVDSLFVMAGHGALIQFDLDTKLASNVAKEKICDDTPIELEVEPKAHWNLGRRREGSQEIMPPLSMDNWLMKNRNSCMLTDSTRQYDDGDEVKDNWLAQVEITTHAGPHRRLWMGPQFVFKTYNTPSGSNLNHVDAEAVEIGIASTTTAATAAATRSSPLNMPITTAGRAAMPVLIESGSYSSIEHSPKLMDRFRHEHLDSDFAVAHGDTRLKEDLADAMRESPSVSASHKDTGRLPSDGATSDNPPFYDALAEHDNDDADDPLTAVDSYAKSAASLGKMLPNLYSFASTSSENESLDALRKPKASIEKVVNPLGTVTTITAGMSTEVKTDILDEVVSQLASEDCVIHENCDEALFRPVVAIFCDENARKAAEKEEEARKDQGLCNPPEVISNKLIVPVIAKEVDAEMSKREKAQKSGAKAKQQALQYENEAKQKFEQLSSFNKKTKGKEESDDGKKNEKGEIRGSEIKVQATKSGVKGLKRQDSKEDDAKAVVAKTNDKRTKAEVVEISAVERNKEATSSKKDNKNDDEHLVIRLEKSVEVAGKTKIIAKTSLKTEEKPVTKSEATKSSFKIEMTEKTTEASVQTVKPLKAEPISKEIEEKATPTKSVKDIKDSKEAIPATKVIKEVIKPANEAKQESAKDKNKELKKERTQNETEVAKTVSSAIEEKSVVAKPIEKPSPKKNIKKETPPDSEEENVIEFKRMTLLAVEKPKGTGAKTKTATICESKPKTKEYVSIEIEKPKNTPTKSSSAPTAIEKPNQSVENRKKPVPDSLKPLEPIEIYDVPTTTTKKDKQKLSSKSNSGSNSEDEIEVVAAKPEKSRKSLEKATIEKQSSASSDDLADSLLEMKAKLEETMYISCSEKIEKEEPELVISEKSKKPQVSAAKGSNSKIEKDMPTSKSETAAKSLKEIEPLPMKQYKYKLVECEPKSPQRKKDIKSQQPEVDTAVCDKKSSSPKSDKKNKTESQVKFVEPKLDSSVVADVKDGNKMSLLKNEDDVKVITEQPTKRISSFRKRSPEEIAKAKAAAAEGKDMTDVLNWVLDNKSSNAKSTLSSPKKDPKLVAKPEENSKTLKSKDVTDNVVRVLEDKSSEAKDAVSSPKKWPKSTPIPPPSSAWKTLSGVEVISKNLEATKSVTKSEEQYPSLGAMGKSKRPLKAESEPVIAEKLLPDLPTPLKPRTENATMASKPNNKKNKKAAPPGFEDFSLEPLPPLPALEPLDIISAEPSTEETKSIKTTLSTEQLSLINFESPLQENPALERKITPAPRGFSEQNLIFALCGSLHYENEGTKTDDSPTLSMTRSNSLLGEQSIAEYKSLTENDEQYMSLEQSSQETNTTNTATTNEKFSSSPNSSSEEIIVLEEVKLSKKQRRKRLQMELAKKSEATDTPNENCADEELRPLIAMSDSQVEKVTDNTTNYTRGNGGVRGRNTVMDLLLALRPDLPIAPSSPLAHSTTTDSEGPMPATTSDDNVFTLPTPLSISTHAPNKVKTKKLEHKINLLAAIEAATSSSTSSAEESGVEAGRVSDIDTSSVLAVAQPTPAQASASKKKTKRRKR